MKSLDKRFWLSDWTNSTQHSSDALNGEFFFHSIVASCRPVLADSHDSSYYYYMCTSFYLHYRTVRVGLLQALQLVSVLLRHPFRLPSLSFSLLQYSQIIILLFYLRIAFTISTAEFRLSSILLHFYTPISSSFLFCFTMLFLCGLSRLESYGSSPFFVSTTTLSFILTVRPLLATSSHDGWHCRSPFRTLALEIRH